MPHPRAAEGPLLVGGLTVAFLWALTPIIHKGLLGADDDRIDWKVILVVGGLSYFACLVLFAAYHWKDICSRAARTLTPRATFWIVIGSAVCGFVANLIYLTVLRNHDSHIVSALIYCSPIFSVMLAYLLLREDVHPMGLVGILLITAGVVCIAFSERK